MRKKQWKKNDKKRDTEKKMSRKYTGLGYDICENCGNPYSVRWFEKIKNGDKRCLVFRLRKFLEHVRLENNASCPVVCRKKRECDDDDNGTLGNTDEYIGQAYIKNIKEIEMKRTQFLERMDIIPRDRAEQASEREDESEIFDRNADGFKYDLPIHIRSVETR